MKKSFTLAEVLMAKGESGNKCLHLISRTNEPKEPTINTKFKVAFTLAEVLITLAIIGIVASITIPPVIRNYKLHELEVRLKEGYSILSNALNLSISQNGPTSKWNYKYTYNSNGTKNYVDKYFVPYMDIVKECTPSVCPYDKQYSGNSPNLNTGNGVYRIFLKNGIIINFYDWLGPRILIDTNGLKGPNKMGYEIFYFYVENNKIRTTQDVTGRSFSNLVTHYCLANRAEASFCTAVVIKNNWKIPTMSQYVKWGGSANNYMWK